jgi:hypothetical protein
MLRSPNPARISGMSTPRDRRILLDGPRRARRYRRRRSAPSFLRLLTIVAAVLALVGSWILIRSLIGPDPVHLVVVGVDGEPVVGAVVTTEGGASARTDDEGSTRLAFGAPQRLTVEAPGYRDASYDVADLPRQGPLSLTMNPWVLQGRVVDDTGNGLTGATIEIDGKAATSGDFGTFELTAVEPGPLVVSKVAWEPTEMTWSGESGRIDVRLRPFVAKGLRVYSRVAGSPDEFARLLDMIDGTVINTLVFDTKQEDGQVTHDIPVPAAHDAGSVVRFYDAAQALAQAKDRGLYTITRIVTFQDPIMAEHQPDWAILHSDTGDVWRNSAGFAWLDPTNRDTWEYPIALAVEACRLGFDEIQFDYVRFPSDGNIFTTVYSVGRIEPGETGERIRVETIAAFLHEARSRIHAEGCAVAADIFGIILSVGNDQGIGQRVEELSHATDVLSPMVYPSHYGPNWLGFADPNDHPGAVVDQALRSGMPRLEGGALMRPWLQGFLWNSQQVRESIAVAERAGTGWMLWNAVSAFEREWLPSLGG